MFVERPQQKTSHNIFSATFLKNIYYEFRARPIFYIALIYIAIASLKISGKNLIHHPPPNNIQTPSPSSCEGKILNWPSHISKGRIKFILKKTDKESILAITDEEIFYKYKKPLIPGAIIKLEKGRYITPQSARNPGEFDYQKYLASKNITAIFYHYTSDGKISLLKNPPMINQILADVRSHIIFSIKKYVSDENFSAGILIQMLTGDVDESARENVQPYFSATGVAHVLVISGLHVGYIIAIFWMLFRLTGIGVINSAICTLPFIWAYAFIAGWTAPVVRAAIMASVMMTGLFIKKTYDSYQAIGISTLITLILFMNPCEIFSVGFQLSYLATFGIIHILKNLPLPQKISRLPFGIGYISSLLWMSAAAQLFTAPIIASYFGFLSGISFPANLIVVPIAGITLGLGIFISATSLVSTSISAIAGTLTSYLLKFMFISIKYLAELPIAKIITPPPGIFFTFIYYLWLTSTPLFIKNKMRSAAILTSLLFLVGLAGHHIITHIKKPILECTFLDVKNGAKFSLIELKNETTILVNAGAPYEGETPVSKTYLPFLRRKAITKIDIVIITSPELTRYGAIEKILDDIPIKKIYTTPAISLWPEYISLMEKLENLKIPIYELWPEENELKINDSTTLKFIKTPYPSTDKNPTLCLTISNKKDATCQTVIYFLETSYLYAIIEQIQLRNTHIHREKTSISANGAKTIYIYNNNRIVVK